MSGVELAACPFCGGSAKLIVPRSAPYVLCERCHAGGPVSSSANAEEAIAAWNRRAATMEAVAALSSRPVDDTGGEFSSVNPEAVAWREKVVAIIRDHVQVGDIGTCSIEIIGHEDAADAILQALALIPQAEET